MFIFFVSALHQYGGQWAKKLPGKSPVKNMFSDKDGAMLIVKRADIGILCLLVLRRHDKNYLGGDGLTFIHESHVSDWNYRLNWLTFFPK